MTSPLTEMVNEYHPKTNNEKNAIEEVLQEGILLALSRAGFFDEAAFYGGTALRIFYGLDRFSEDLDFSLLTKNQNFDFSIYLPKVQETMKSLGIDVEIQKKEKTKDSNIQSAFLKENTIEQFLLFYPSSSIAGVNKNEKIKIKFELDINPPGLAAYQKKYRLKPIPYSVLLYDDASLFSGKIHAVLCRGWHKRIKGRDLYDYVFYLTRGTKMNLPHLREKLIDSGRLQSDEELTVEDVKQLLNNRFEEIDYESAKSDVLPFINDPATLDIWSAEFFSSITESLKAQDNQTK